MHEYTKNHALKIQSSSDRSFGLVFAGASIIVALFPLVLGEKIRLWWLAIGAAFLFLALFSPLILAPANRLWTNLGVVLHQLVSPIALGVVYYLAVVPTGLLMRVFDKDPLRLRFDSSLNSYWIDRSPPGPSADSLNNQF